MRSQPERYYKFPDDEEYFSQVLTQQGKLIGEGLYGSVYEVTITIEKGGRHKEKSFARKEYNRSEYALKAWENYQLVKAAGLPTWTTCRLSHEMKLLMTNGEVESFVVIGAQPDSESASRLTKEKIKISAQEIRDISRQVVNIAHKAAEKKLWIPADAYLFCFRTENSNLQDIKVIVGDLDGVETLESSDVTANMERAKIALNLFFQNYTDDGVEGSLIRDIIKEFFPN